MTRRTVCQRWLAPLSLALLLGGLVLVLPAAPASAAPPLHVTDCGDAGAGTLRGQIAAAVAGDTIVFDLNCTGATAVTLTTGTLTIATNNLTIDSNGHTVTVDGNNSVTVITVNGAVTASLSALTIQHGNAVSGNGGGINNNGTLTVTNSTFLVHNQETSSIIDRCGS